MCTVKTHSNPISLTRKNSMHSTQDYHSTLKKCSPQMKIPQRALGLAGSVESSVPEVAGRPVSVAFYV